MSDGLCVGLDVVMIDDDWWIERRTGSKHFAVVVDFDTTSLLPAVGVSRWLIRITGIALHLYARRTLGQAFNVKGYCLQHTQS